MVSVFGSALYALLTAVMLQFARRLESSPQQPSVLEPQIAPLFFALQKKFLADSHAVGASTDPRIAQLVLLWQADVDAYREENIPLQVRATNLASVYDKTCGAMTATFQGAEQTLQQLAKHLDDTDRSVRETAWELIAERHLRDEDLLNETFDEFVLAGPIKTSSPLWKQVQNGVLHSGSQLHGALDYYNNTGQTSPGGTLYANCGDAFDQALAIYESAHQSATIGMASLTTTKVAPTMTTTTMSTSTVSQMSIATTDFGDSFHLGSNALHTYDLI